MVVLLPTSIPEAHAPPPRCPTLPLTGNWQIISSCVIHASTTPPESVMVLNGSVLVILNGGILTIPSGQSITIESGSGVLIKDGGTLQVNS